MAEIDPYIQRLLDANPIREPVLRRAIQALHLPLGSRGLDVGCGIGLQALLLADAVGSRGHVTGIDLLPELLAFGEGLVQKAGFSERITLQEGDAGRLPFAENSFDWVWSADCIGYPAGELSPVLNELMRVTRPGGSIIILAWSSQHVLPGHPILEDRMNAGCSSYIPFLKGKAPQQHFLRAAHWFREVGLMNAEVQTFVGDVHAPLNQPQRAGLTSLFEMLWGAPGPEAPSEDCDEFLRLCKPESPDFILDEPDYYGFFTYTVFRGQVPRR